MPFIEDAVFERQEKKEQMEKEIEKKKERNYINDQAKPEETEKKGVVLKEIMKRHKPEPKITMNDIKNELRGEIELNKIVTEQRDCELADLLKKEEVVEIKNEAINLLAMPHTHPIKRKIFAQKLKNSEIVNSFVDNNVIFKLFNRVNENLKFGVVYGLKYLQTHDDYNNLVRLQEQMKAQGCTVQLPPQAQPTPQPEPEPEQTEETEEDEETAEQAEEIKEE